MLKQKMGVFPTRSPHPVGITSAAFKHPNRWAFHQTNQHVHPPISHRCNSANSAEQPSSRPSNNIPSVQTPCLSVNTATVDHFYGDDQFSTMLSPNDWPTSSMVQKLQLTFSAWPPSNVTIRKLVHKDSQLPGHNRLSWSRRGGKRRWYLLLSTRYFFFILQRMCCRWVAIFNICSLSKILRIMHLHVTDKFFTTGNKK